MIDTSTGSININERMHALKEPKNISGKNFIISVYFVNAYLKEIQLYLVDENE